jgi:cell division septation protein DedD
MAAPPLDHVPVPANDGDRSTPDMPLPRGELPEEDDMPPRTSDPIVPLPTPQAILNAALGAADSAKAAKAAAQSAATSAADTYHRIGELLGEIHAFRVANAERFDRLEKAVGVKRTMSGQFFRAVSLPPPPPPIEVPRVMSHTGEHVSMTTAQLDKLESQLREREAREAAVAEYVATLESRAKTTRERITFASVVLGPLIAVAAILASLLHH